MKRFALIALLGVALSTALYADTFPDHTNYDVCFTPGNDCTSFIVKEINQANQSIYVQAYSFTSAPIAKAITDAKKRGLLVKIILDKSQINNNQYSAAKYLMNQHIPVWIDDKPAIAHNKVMIIDNNTLITGSFNFTKAAQEKNAENVLIIHDKGIAATYLKNWYNRQSVSIDTQ